MLSHNRLQLHIQKMMHAFIHSFTSLFWGLADPSDFRIYGLISLLPYNLGYSGVGMPMQPQTQHYLIMLSHRRSQLGVQKILHGLVSRLPQVHVIGLGICQALAGGSCLPLRICQLALQAVPFRPGFPQILQQPAPISNPADPAESRLNQYAFFKPGQRRGASVARHATGAGGSCLPLRICQLALQANPL